MAPPKRPFQAAYTVLTLETGAETAEALAERACAAFGVEPVQLLKPNAARAWVDLYFADGAAALLAARVVERWPDVWGQGIRAVAPQDWQRFWRRHFHARRIGESLWIVPVWDRRTRPPRGARTIRMEPGLSFGTGDHFTTRYCLEAIERLCRSRAPRTLLDVGAGSGILAIAAARLGVRSVLATDNDLQALAQARKNAKRNRVLDRIRFRAADILASPPRKRFDAVCANLYGGLLIRAAEALTSAARDRLILSGIREAEADAVAEAYVARGAREIERDGDGEWCGMTFDLSPTARRG